MVDNLGVIPQKVVSLQSKHYAMIERKLSQRIDDFFNTKAFLLLFAVMLAAPVWAFDFSAVSPSGHTLYYNILNAREVELAYPGGSSANPYAGFSMPSGALTIPSKVTHDGTTYTVTTLGHVALGYCKELTSIALPNTLILIGQSVFFGCSGLTSLDIPRSVKIIGFQAFYGCTGLKRVSLPNSLTTIEAGAFTLCTGLDSIAIPSSVAMIPSGAFASCSGLKRVRIPTSVTYIGDGAFSNCSGLLDVTIPESVVEIGGSAFTGCSALGSIVLPNSVTRIGSWAFYMCRSLKGVALPETLTDIEPSVFYECDSLRSVAIPNSVASIGDHAFRACGSLESVTLGGGLKSIGRTAFAECAGLKEIISEAVVAPILGEDVFKGVDALTPVHIPCGSRLSYYARWSHFGNYTEDHTFALEASPADSTQGSVEVLTPPTCVSPQAVVNAIPARGCQFDKWSDGERSNPYLLTVTADTVLRAVFATKEADVQYVHDTTFIHDTIYVDLWHYDTVMLAADQLTAIFSESQEVDISGGGDFVITTSRGQIIVGNAAHQRIRIFDGVGRLMATHTGGEAVRVFNVPSSGAYLVQVGNYPAQKVVVIR